MRCVTLRVDLAQSGLAPVGVLFKACNQAFFAYPHSVSLIVSHVSHTLHRTVVFTVFDHLFFFRLFSLGIDLDPTVTWYHNSQPLHHPPPQTSTQTRFHHWRQATTATTATHARTSAPSLDMDQPYSHSPNHSQSSLHRGEAYRHNSGDSRQTLSRTATLDSRTRTRDTLGNSDQGQEAEPKMAEKDSPRGSGVPLGAPGQPPAPNEVPGGVPPPPGIKKFAHGCEC